ncbi:MAG: branched-chain amino acid ABC transporter permease [Pyrinomonadaceae bacterium]
MTSQSQTIARRSFAQTTATTLPFVLLIFFAVMPLIGLSPNNTKILFVTLLWITTSVAWNLLGGFAGQVSFGFAVFYGLGAYATALLMNGGVNQYVSLLIAAAIAALASLLIGLPTFNLRGPYFAIATIGVSETVRVVMNNLSITGGASGYRILEHKPFNQNEHYFEALVLATLAVIVSIIIRKSKFGLGLIAIREDEQAAADLGLNGYKYKLAVHAVAAALTGIAGGVFARYASFIHSDGVFAFNTSVSILLMPVIGGLGTVWGAVIGGIFYGTVQEQLVAAFPDLHLMIYGILLIMIILFEPGGIVGLFYRLLNFYRARRS